VSFILDALRKSEHDRQRQTGPALVEVAVASPKPRTNSWATAAIILLLVNLVAIGALLLYKSRGDSTTPPVATTPVPASEAPPASPAPAAQASVTETRQVPAAPPPMLRPALPERSNATGRNPLADEVSGGTAPALDGEVARGASAAPAGPPAVTAGPVRPGTVVYESLPETGQIGGPRAPAPSTSPPGLPAADEFTSQAGLPELRLELHVYAPQPQNRFVFINSHRYREGETTAEGVIVRQITSDGAVLEFRGNRFFLSRD
jgi:general secretion pathway protein B